MKPLSAQFLEAVAFDAQRVYRAMDKNNLLRDSRVVTGADFESNRLAPIHAAVAEALSAAENAFLKDRGVQEALARLAEVLAKREGGGCD